MVGGSLRVLRLPPLPAEILEKLKVMGINVDLLIHVALYKQIVVFSSGISL
jgi:hypothetical protein